VALLGLRSSVAQGAASKVGGYGRQLGIPLHLLASPWWGYSGLRVPLANANRDPGLMSTWDIPLISCGFGLCLVASSPNWLLMFLANSLYSIFRLQAASGFKFHGLGVYSRVLCGILSPSVVFSGVVMF